MPISRERLRELDDRFRLCVCCHVRTATMAIGTLQALILFFALASFSSHSIRPSEMYYSRFSTATNSNTDPVIFVGPESRNLDIEPLKASRDPDSFDTIVLLFGQLSGYSSDNFNGISPEHRHGPTSQTKSGADELFLNNGMLDSLFLQSLNYCYHIIGYIALQCLNAIRNILLLMPRRSWLRPFLVVAFALRTAS